MKHERQLRSKVMELYLPLVVEADSSRWAKKNRRLAVPCPG
jgi:hypothetical protein